MHPWARLGRLAALACFLTSLILSGAGDGARAADDARFVHLARFDVMDPYGWAAPVVAFSFLAPADWRLEGGVTWNPRWRCRNEIAVTHARATSPDGQFAFEMFPGALWEWMDDPLFAQMRQQQLTSGAQACPASPLSGAEQFLTRYLVPTVRPGAQVLEVVTDPNVARAAEIKIRAAAPGGTKLQLEVDAARVTVALPDGRREWLTATSFRSLGQTPAPSAAVQGMYVMANHYALGAANIFAFSAPAGALQQNAALFGTILASMRINPVWEQAMLYFFAGIDSAALGGAIDRANIWRKAQGEIGQVIVSSWQQRQESQDRIASQWSQTMLGTATYADPSGGFVGELPDGYAGVWSNGAGEILLAVDPGFDPNRELGTGAWTRLEKRN